MRHGTRKLIVDSEVESWEVRKLIIDSGGRKLRGISPRRSIGLNELLANPTT
jgi:hypothetical protein